MQFKATVEFFQLFQRALRYKDDVTYKIMQKDFADVGHHIEADFYSNRILNKHMRASESLRIRYINIWYTLWSLDKVIDCRHCVIRV